MNVNPLKAGALLVAAIVLAGCTSMPGNAGGDTTQVDWFAWHARGPGGAPLAPRLTQTLKDPSGTPFDLAPTAFDVNGDGRDEIIVQGNDTNVYVFDSQTGKTLAKLPTTTPKNWYVERVLNAVAAGVLKPGEPASLVVTSHAAFLSVWRF
jgi:ABC-type glycerol-3-phosphate transport system substrate-binding protein